MYSDVIIKLLINNLIILNHLFANIEVFFFKILSIFSYILLYIFFAYNGCFRLFGTLAILRWAKKEKQKYLFLSMLTKWFTIYQTKAFVSQYIIVQL